MNYWLLGGVFVLSALALAWWQVPILKTLYLIARVTPYEQVPAEATHTMLVLGDSTGYGTGATASRLTVAGRIGTTFPELKIINDSVNGRTIAEGLEAFEETQPEQTYDVIVLQLGANDILGDRDIDTVLTELETLFQLTNERATQVLMMSGGNIGASYRFTGTKAQELTDRSRTYYTRYTELAEQYDVTFIDLFEDSDTDPFVQNPTRYTAIDGLHPTNEGYAYWYEKLKKELTPLLK